MRNQWSILLLLLCLAQPAISQNFQIGIPDSAQNLPFPGSTGAYTINNPLGNNGAQFNNPPITSSCAMNCRADYLYFYDLSLSIPANATITGVELIHGRGGCNQGSFAIDTIQLAHQGNLIGGSKRDSTSNQAVDTLGSSSDLWGAVLTPAMVNDPSFGLMVRTTSTGICTFGQFEARLVVHYCAQGAMVQAIPDSVTNVAFPGSTGSYNVSNPLSHNGTQFTNAPITVSCVSNCVSDYLYFRDLDLAIPANATIEGIEIEHLHSGCNQGAYVIDTLQLAYLGQRLGVVKRDSSDNGPTITLGGNTDLWGIAPTAAMLNDPSFGVMVRSTGTGICTHGQWDLRFNIYLSCNPITAVAAPAAEMLGIFPNPARDRIHVQAPGPLTGVRCYNLMGQAVGLPEVAGGYDASQLPRGHYLVVAQRTNGQQLTGRFVKE